MNKKIFLFFVLSLISNNLLYGEDNTEKIIRKNGRGGVRNLFAIW